MGISALLSTPIDARAGPFRMVRPMNLTTAAYGATQVSAASNTALVTAAHLYPTVLPTGGSSPYRNISVPHNNPTITVSHKPTATPSTSATYHDADHPRNPGYVCRQDYAQCYARAPHPADSEYINALEANDQDLLEAHEKEMALATENDDTCHAAFKTCLGFGLGPVLPDDKDDKVISPRQRKGQEKHTLPLQEQGKQASKKARIASDFKHKTIPVDSPSVREHSAGTNDRPVGFGRSPILPRSEKGLEQRAYLTEEEQKAHYKSSRLGVFPVRSGPMGAGPILPRGNVLENEEGK